MKPTSLPRPLRARLLSVVFFTGIAMTLAACGGGSAEPVPPVVVTPPVTPPVVVVPPVATEPPVITPPVATEPPVITPPVTTEPPVIVAPPVVVTPPVVVAPPVSPTPPVSPPVIILPPINKPGGSPLNPVAAVSGDDNVAPIYVDANLPGSADIPNSIFADVKICAPGSADNCTVIDHVLVDTGSVGLRLFASEIPGKLLAGLPNVTSNSEPVGQCIAFISAVTWGSVRKADIHMGGINHAGKTATNMTIQVIADPGTQFANVPATCQNQGVLAKTAAQLGAKGILGIGLFAEDCGTACVTFAPPVYYSCAQQPCRQTQVPLSVQVGNPVIGFGADNNGNLIVLPPLPNHVAGRVDGLLIFGLGTRANNALPAGSSTLAATNLGYFSSQFNGRTLPNSYIDSGTTANAFPADGIINLPLCSYSNAFFCPGSDLQMIAVNTGLKGSTSTFPLLVVDALAKFAAYPGAHAFEGLSMPTNNPPNSLILGASFFFGRTVGTLIDSRSAIGINVEGPAFTHTP